jgi:hypothetical protein
MTAAAKIAAGKKQPLEPESGFKSATIDLDGGIRCVVLGQSDSKARIEVSSAQRLPNEFWISIDGEANLRCCGVAWRGKKRIGVFFI